MRKILIYMISSIAITGCKPEFLMDTQERFEKVCTQALSDALETYAKYDGWSVNEIKYLDVQFEKDNELNEKYKTEQFFSFKLLGQGAKVKNGFGVLSNSVVECAGNSSLISEKYSIPKPFSVDVRLDGRRIDTRGQLDNLGK